MTKRVARETWAKRVAEWRESGLTSEKFCEGRDFTSGGLRHWAHRLGQTKRRTVERPTVRVARVVRVPKPVVERSATRSEETALVVEVGGARVSVRRGFDRETLTEVIAVLTQSGKEAR